MLSDIEKCIILVVTLLMLAFYGAVMVVCIEQKNTLSVLFSLIIICFLCVIFTHVLFSLGKTDKDGLERNRKGR